MPPNRSQSGWEVYNVANQVAALGSLSHLGAGGPTSVYIMSLY